MFLRELFQAAASGAPATSDAASGEGKLIEDYDSISEQASVLTRDFFNWVRGDSLEILIGFGAGLLLYGVLVLVRAWARRHLSRTAQFGSWPWVAFRVVAKTRSFFLAMFSARIIFALLGAPGTWNSLVGVLFAIASAVQGAFWVRELLVSMVERKAADSATDPSMSSAVGVLTIIINVVVWVVAGIILLDNLGVNVTALIAGLGVGGIAIGLAAQNIFSDLFAALSILLDQPFKRGDTIQIGGPQGVVGKVEHIGLKTTRLRAVGGEVVVLSNANLLNQQINNLAHFNHRRVSMTLQLIYQTSPNVLEEIPGILENLVKSVPNVRFDYAAFSTFNASSIDFDMVFFVESAGFSEMVAARQRVGFAILREFEKRNINFAYPSQMSFIGGVDGLIVDPQEAKEMTR